MKKIISAALAAAMLVSSFVIPASAASVAPKEAPVVHYDFKQIDDIVVKNISESDSEGAYDGELAKEPQVNKDEAYVTTNGAGVMEASKVLIPTMAFTDIETGECSVTMYVRLKQELGDCNRVLLGVGREGGNEHNMFGLRVYNGPENGYEGGMRLLGRTDTGDSVQDGTAAFDEKPNAELKVGEWALVTMTQKGNVTKVYVNSEEVIAINDFAYNLAGRAFPDNHTVAVGADLTNGEPGFIGDISDVRVYGYALSADEVAGVIDDIQGNFNVKEITLDKSELKLTEGDVAQIIATVKPDTALNKTVLWTTDKADVVKVDANGKITAVKEGTAVITATAMDGEFKATCKVTVAKKVIAVSGVKAPASVKLTVGKSKTVAAEVSPANATDKNVVWKSANDKIAAVVNGRITAKKPGKTTVTATVGGKTATVRVTVAPAQVKGVKLSGKKKKAIVKFKAVKGASKYQVVLKKGKKTTKKTVKKSGASIKLKAGKYTVQIRAYGGGQYGAYSKKASVKVK